MSFSFVSIMLILNTWSIWAKVLCKQMILLRWSYLYQETNSLKGRLTVVLFLGLLCYFLFFFFVLTVEATALYMPGSAVLSYGTPGLSDYHLEPI